MILPDMTARTRFGAVDLVPLIRRINGDKTVSVPEHEQHAAVLALHAAGYPFHHIRVASGLGDDTVHAVLADEEQRQARERAVQHQRAKWNRNRQTRLAQRVKVNGRLIHPYAPRHGTNSTYHAYGCRCGPCSRAHTEYQAEARRKART